MSQHTDIEKNMASEESACLAVALQGCNIPMGCFGGLSFAMLYLPAARALRDSASSAVFRGRSK